MLIANVRTTVPANDGARIENTGSATVYVGGSAVTTASGFPVSSTDGVVNIPNTGLDRGVVWHSGDGWSVQRCIHRGRLIQTTK